MIIKEKETFTNNLIDDILTRSVEDINFHMSPTDKYALDVSRLTDIPLFGRAAELLYINLLDVTKQKIAIVVDQDMDGYTSAALFVKFMQEINCPIDILIDEGKTHGLTDNLMEQIIGNYNLVIIPDAGSNDIKQHQTLLVNEVDFIVLDHHEVLDSSIEYLNTSNKGIVINNQLLDINKNYTGVGMTYIFLEFVGYIENLTNKEFENSVDFSKYLDLVALGQVADVSDVADKEIRYYVTKGLNNINNPFIKSVMNRKGLDEMTGRDASFSIISMVNAVTRVGTIEEKHRLFDALVSDSLETSTVEVRKKNKTTGKFDKIPTEMTIHDIVVKECESIKTKQDKIVKKHMANVSYIYENQVVIGLLDEDAPSSITGLVGMKISDKERKPVMIGKRYSQSLSGSLRAPDGLDFKQILTDSGLFDFVSGHASAAGWRIEEDNLENLYEYLDNYEFSNNTTEYMVDKLYNKPIEFDIYTVEMEKHVFGGKINYPMFGYENIKFNIRCINTRGSVTTFFDNGVSFILFNSPEDIKKTVEKNLDNNSVTMNIVGEPRINKFGNKEIPQIVIKDYEFVDNYDIVEEENEFGIDF